MRTTLRFQKSSPYYFHLGMLNDYRIFDYRIKCSFSFSFVSHSILSRNIAQICSLHTPTWNTRPCMLAMIKRSSEQTSRPKSLICGTDVTNYLPAVTSYVHSPPLPSPSRSPVEPWAKMNLQDQAVGMTWYSVHARKLFADARTSMPGTLGETDK